MGWYDELSDNLWSVPPTNNIILFILIIQCAAVKLLIVSIRKPLNCSLYLRRWFAYSNLRHTLTVCYMLQVQTQPGWVEVSFWVDGLRGEGVRLAPLLSIQRVKSDSSESTSTVWLNQSFLLSRSLQTRKVEVRQKLACEHVLHDGGAG